MAKSINIDKEKHELIVTLQKSVQSANINFLIGSGCSYPALKVLGNIEEEIETKIKNNKQDEAEKLIFDFLKPFVPSTEKIINNSKDSKHITTLGNYQSFLAAISKILFERKSNILHKQATVFSTNYDLFIEKAAEQFTGSIILNDGFKRTPSLTNTFVFSPSEYFNTVYNTGNLYNYQVEIPSINIIKLHGSLSWQIASNNIIFSLEYLKKSKKLINSNESLKISEFNDFFSVILPRKDKFKETLLNKTYYDLLRIYANELDKENTLLITEGFSFADEHILELTERALKNPTLKLIVFCFNKNELEGYKSKFSSYNNVDIVYSKQESIDFAKFNTILDEILPKKYEEVFCKVKNKEPADE